MCRIRKASKTSRQLYWVPTDMFQKRKGYTKSGLFYCRKLLVHKAYSWYLQLLPMELSTCLRHKEYNLTQISNQFHSDMFQHYTAHKRWRPFDCRTYQLRNSDKSTHCRLPWEWNTFLADTWYSFPYILSLSLSDMSLLSTPHKWWGQPLCHMSLGHSTCKYYSQ